MPFVLSYEPEKNAWKRFESVREHLVGKSNKSMIFFGIYFVESIASISGFVQSMNGLEIETKSLKYLFWSF